MSDLSPLSGVKRKERGHRETVAFDPGRTFWPERPVLLEPGFFEEASLRRP
jgi:hypothetical protein